MAPWRLSVLGEARLSGVAGPLPPLQKRTAAVLAYLALEGPTPKYRLAGLLWPDSGEDTARNNMRQLLRRLRTTTGTDLVLGTETISLSEEVVTDAVELQAHVLASRYEEALALGGGLLGNMDFDDCPDFEAWLSQAREQLETLRRRAAGAASDACEQKGDLTHALSFAQRLLALDPLAEEAYRRLMRLHYLAGDRAAALGLFERCRQMLREEFDATPHPSTAALARDIERGQVAPPAVSGPSPVLPLSVLRPPVLVGRQREWTEMEESWQARRVIMLMAEPGGGKTRLALDFAASKGPYTVFQSRPGDVHVPYSLYTRNIRRMLSERPELRQGLEPWIRRELARVMPEFGVPGQTLPPMRAEAERARFLDALGETFRRCLEGQAAFVGDDIQFADAASLEVGAYCQSRFSEEGAFPRIIDCCRTGELSAEALSIVKRVEAAGLLTVIHLGPLSPEAVETLLDSLVLPGAVSLGKEMARYTGGNPLYITETLKHLLESGNLEGGWPERMPASGRVRKLVEQRLERLSQLALQLAQVAALALADFELELAGEVLELSPLVFAAPLRELEAAQLFHGDRFSHDVVLESVRDSIPSALRSLLHRRLARALEKRGGAPATIAQHWLKVGEQRLAVPFLLAAAMADESNLRKHEAAENYQLAASILESLGEQKEAARVRERLHATGGSEHQTDA
ncbi:BTAD domain-containing putative transcriptional regulator [Archangium violaceum]|uniref:BTAD domain-containing putative transcriptional regulator n=1 Tax=Archangium violaceum TaxID=83451 RepID=UPI0037C0265A